MIAPKRTIKFWPRLKPERNIVPIHMNISWNNERLIIPTGIKIETKHWEKKGEKKKNGEIGVGRFKNTLEVGAIKNKIIQIEQDAYLLFDQFVDTHNRYPDKNELKSLFKNELSLSVKTKTFKSKITLFDFINEFITQSKKRVNPHTNKVLSSSTIQSYKRTLKYLKAFNEENPFGFNDVNIQFYNNFYSFLVDKNFSTNTIGKLFKEIKVFMNEALERGLTKNDSFKSKKFKTVTEKSHSIALSEVEIRAMYEINLSNNKSLERTRDLFIVGCTTGLRYSDFSKIDRSNFEDKNLIVRSQKTNMDVIIPVDPLLKEIMTKYSYRLPEQANSKFNKNIKEVAKKVDALKIDCQVHITKGGKVVKEVKKKWELIGSHTCRRSFATNQYLKGIPTHTIMSVTNHAKESTFLNYLKIDQAQHAEIMRKGWGKVKKVSTLKAM